MQSDPKINVYINARFLTQPTTGVQRYAIELVKALDSLIEQDKDNDFSRFKFTLLSPKSTKYNLTLKHINSIKIGFLEGHLWEQIELPFFSRDGYLISLANTAPIFKINQLATIHDVSVFAIPNAYSFSFRNWYKFLFLALNKISRKILTVSYFSQSEIIKYLRADQDKVKVVYEGKEHILAIDSDRSFLERNELLDKTFILVVSSMSPHKNFATTLLAIEELSDTEIYTVIVGINYPSVFMPPKLITSDKVQHLGFVTDAELKALYEHAFCFVHPTLYEGFGLPPLEAMACGCPIVISNTASLPEIYGESALYFDPKNPKDIAKKIRQLFEDARLREMLVQKSKEHIEKFSWHKCAQEVYAILNETF
jgi:glycosyltransferase involved in cell wall biosynthesis